MRHRQSLKALPTARKKTGRHNARGLEPSLLGALTNPPYHLLTIVKARYLRSFHCLCSHLPARSVYNSYRRRLCQQMRRTVAAYEQLSNFREPLRDGAPSVPEQAAQLHHLPFNYFLLRAAEGRNERKPPRRSSQRPSLDSSKQLSQGALRAEPDAARHRSEDRHAQEPPRRYFPSDLPPKRLRSQGSSLITFLSLLSFLYCFSPMVCVAMPRQKKKQNKR